MNVKAHVKKSIREEKGVDTGGFGRVTNHA
jgi:hypothetical protein